MQSDGKNNFSNLKGLNMIPLKNSIIKDSDKLSIFSSSLSPKNKENNLGNTVKIPLSTKNADSKIFLEKNSPKSILQNTNIKFPKNELKSKSPFIKK